MSRKLRYIFRYIGYLLVLIWLCVLTACFQGNKPTPSSHPNLLLGNPSNATTDIQNSENYLMLKPQYVLSYARSKGIPNWVSWRLQASDLAAPGSSRRQNDFRADPTLPAGWPVTQPGDYTGSGFDRGHLANSADRNHSPEDNSATFLMTNIIPQSPDNNRGVWEKLESECRELVRQGKELYIIAGPQGQGGVGDKGARRELRGGQVVPAKTWKVVLVLDRPGTRIPGINSQTRTIAVVIPNTQGIKYHPWRAYRKTVRDVEKMTGYDFFNNVPTAIQEAIENRLDDQ